MIGIEGQPIDDGGVQPNSAMHRSREARHISMDDHWSRHGDRWRYVPSMSAHTINLESLFDADEYHRSGNCPWTFFAYPTTLAVEHGLPPDDDACSLLADIQDRGIDVAIWVNAIADNTTYFACKQGDVERLNHFVEELETTVFGKNFCAERSEARFAWLEHGT